MADAQGAGAFIGVGVQAAFATAVEAAVYSPAKAGGLTMERPSKGSDTLYGVEQVLQRAQNTKFGGSFALECYFNRSGHYLSNMFKGTRTAQTSYVVNAGNNKIDLDIGGGVVTGTIASASYTSTTLAAAIVVAMNAAAAGTYTCTYSTTTKKFTVTKSAGTLTLPWVTGTSNATSIASTIGFTADDASALTYTADAAKAEVYSYSYVFEPTGQFLTAQGQTYGLTLLDHLDLFTKQGRSGFATGLTLAYGDNDPHAPALTFTFTGAELTRIASVTPTFSTDVPAAPEGAVTLAIGVNGHTHTAHSFKTLQLALTNAVEVKHKAGSTIPVKIIRTGRAGITLTFDWDLEDTATDGGSANLGTDHEACWQDFDMLATATLVQTGALLRGAFSESLTVALTGLRPTGATPVAAPGTIQQVYNYTGGRDFEAGTVGCTITLVSNEYIAM